MGNSGRDLCFKRKTKTDRKAKRKGGHKGFSGGGNTNKKEGARREDSRHYSKKPASPDGTTSRWKRGGGRADFPWPDPVSRGPRTKEDRRIQTKQKQKWGEQRGREEEGN